MPPAQSLIRPYTFILCSALAVILFLTLAPFNFVFSTQITLTQLINRFDLALPTNEGADILVNVVIFAPLGFVLTHFLQHAWNKRVSLLGAIILCFLISLTIELLQIFLPRTPAIRDLLTNSLGGIVGYSVYYLGGRQLLALILKYIPIALWQALVLVGLLLYSALILFLATRLRSLDLQNWQGDYRLMFGNELNGNFPWEGQVAEFYMTNQVMTTEEIETVLLDNRGPHNTDMFVAHYQFGQNNFADQARHLPQLRWRGVPTDNPTRDNFVAVGANSWLQTESVATYLSDSVKENSTLTFGIIAATNAVWQPGPGRIVSMGKDSQYRNFMVGQIGPHLAIRLRTTASGVNGTMPELIIPHVFSDKEPHHIVVTYDGHILKAYVDDPQQVYAFHTTPEVQFMRFVFLIPRWHWSYYLTPGGMLMHRLLYALLVFAAWGLLLSLCSHLIRMSSRIRWYWFIIGSLIYPLTLETLYANSGGFIFRIQEFVLSLICVAIFTMIGRHLWMWVFPATIAKNSDRPFHIPKLTVRS
ncbi:MAG: VanZ family protein [Chloroflexota bacterium]